MSTEISEHIDFSILRYGQCWEDADILLKALDIKPDDICFSIASAGDNTLAMLACGPQRLISIDISPAQIASLELRVAAYRELSHPELLELVGSSPSTRRSQLYHRCRKQLSYEARSFWDANAACIDNGIGCAGKFERYLSIFRKLLSLTKSNELIRELMRNNSTEKMRVEFYNNYWNTWQWRIVFRMFFSRQLLGKFGRDPHLFHYTSGNITEHLKERTRHALTVLDPCENPYLQWILLGQHLTALPFSLRPENFEKIQKYIDHLEWHCISLEEFLEISDHNMIDRFNLSDIFEYMSIERYHKLLEKIISYGRSSGRLIYWNLLAERSRPDFMSHKLTPLNDLSNQLFQNDKAFFYSDLVVEEII